MEKMKIFTLADVKADGKAIAFVRGNRDIAAKNKNSKKSSLTRCGMNLVPMLLVEGKKAVEDGCKLMNPYGEEIPDNAADSYYVVVDGQHRYTAAMELKKDAEKMDVEPAITDKQLYFYLDYSGRNTMDLLSITNIESAKWAATDFAKGAVLLHPDDELIQFINEYAQRKMPISTISIYLYGKKDTLQNKNLAASLSTGKLGINSKANLEFAKKIVPRLLILFDFKFVKTRYCADAINDALNLNGTQNSQIVIDVLNSLKYPDVAEVGDLKGDEAQNKLFEILKDKINSAAKTDQLNSHREGYHFRGSLLFAIRGMGLNFKG